MRCRTFLRSWNWSRFFFIHISNRWIFIIYWKGLKAYLNWIQKKKNWPKFKFKQFKIWLMYIYIKSITLSISCLLIFISVHPNVCRNMYIDFLCILTIVNPCICILLPLNVELSELTKILILQERIFFKTFLYLLTRILNENLFPN